MIKAIAVIAPQMISMICQTVISQTSTLFLKMTPFGFSFSTLYLTIH